LEGLAASREGRLNVVFGEVDWGVEIPQHGDSTSCAMINSTKRGLGNMVAKHMHWQCCRNSVVRKAITSITRGAIM
jgi:hypothetical protein